MVLAAQLAADLGMAPNDDAHALVQLLKNFELPTQIPAGLSAQALLARMRLDKKAQASGLRFILWQAAGAAKVVADVPDAAVLATLQANGCAHES